MVINFVGLMQERYGSSLDQQAKGYLDYIVEGADRMRQLIDDLLQYSRIDTQVGPYSQVDMNAVVSEVLESLRMMIEDRDATIEVDAMPIIWGSRVQMGQVIQNLVSNAIKFTKDRPVVKIHASEGAKEWVFSVEDNGIGIDPCYNDKLFQMFQRLNPRDQYPGTGIGLAMSRKIVERHGGAIWVVSEVDKGSKFYFTIAKKKGG